MIQKIISALALSGLLFAPSLAVAKPNSSNFPANAREVAPNVYSLGAAFDKQSDRMVEGYAIVHKKAFAKPSGGATKGTKCYGVMAAGAKWKTRENWILNPTNSEGLSSTFVFDKIWGGLQKWENTASYDIFGNGSLTDSLLEADEVQTDGQNEVYFGDLGTDGTIALTIVWGIFSGPTFGRELVEWDQVYNTYYDWTEDATVETDQMDFDNIATHELGHSAGLADIYTSSCSEVTMYGYGTEGETKKRSLEPADITGINQLY